MRKTVMGCRTGLLRGHMGANTAVIMDINNNRTCDKVMVALGNSDADEKTIRGWKRFFIEKMMRHSDWPEQYGVWTDEESSWGRISMPQNERNPLIEMITATFMNTNEFGNTVTNWAEIRHEPMKGVTVPAKVKSVQI